MKKMKRLLVAFLSCLTAISCIAGIAACGDKEGNKESSKPQSESSIVTPGTSDVTPSTSETPESPKECDHVPFYYDAVLPTCTTNGRAAYWGCEKCDAGNPEPDVPVRADYKTQAEYAKAKAEYDAYWEKWSAKGGAHTWGIDVVEKVEADCCNDGYRAYITCTDCSAVADYEETLFKLENDTTKYGKNIKAKDVIVAVSEAFDVAAFLELTDSKLTVEEVMTIKASGDHKYVEFTPAIRPDCLNEGRTEGWVCENGGSVESEYLEATGHDVGEENEDGKIVYKDKASKAATCTSKAFCGLCDKEYDEMLDHTLVSVDAQAPTCLKAGWEAYEYCENCSYTTFVGLSSKAHWAEQFETENYTKVEKVDATCTDDGVKAHYVCLGCAEGYYTVTKLSATSTAQSKGAESVVAKATGHSATLTTNKAEGVTAVAKKAATCTTDGNTAGGWCSKCKSEVVSETIPAFGHDYDFDGDGVTDRIHTAAGKVEYDEEGNAKPQPNANSAKATCDKDAKCGYCGKYVEETKLGHNWTEVELKYASCIADGMKAHYECENCGKLAIDDADAEDGKKIGTISSLKLKIPAFGHDWETIKKKDSTCAEAGYEQYQDCKRCSEIKDYKVIDKKEHQSNIKDTCSEWLVCEDVWTDKNKNGIEDEGEVVLGCGAIYANPAPAHVAKDGYCTLCGICLHAEKVEGFCPDCGKCEHIAHNEDGLCIKCYVEMEHKYVEGVCSCGKVCEHSWNKGKCEICNVACAHNYEEGVCTICGMACDHSNHTQAGVCNGCAAEGVDHIWTYTEDGKGLCDGCDLICEHAEHNDDGICKVCYYDVDLHVWKAENVNAETGMVKCAACNYEKAVCKHEVHEADPATGNAVCSNEECDKLTAVAHVFDCAGEKADKANNSVRCTVCDAKAKLDTTCAAQNHKYGHTVDTIVGEGSVYTCNACGKEVTHNQADHDSADDDDCACDYCADGAKYTFDCVDETKPNDSEEEGAPATIPGQDGLCDNCGKEMPELV